MKKGLLLSIAASAMIFAGGDIQPVEPAAPAAADFWGQIGFAYQAQDDNGGYSLRDKENNAFSAAVVLGVDKQIAYGFGFGAEVAGWSDMGLDLADKARVKSSDQTSAEISQAYLTYTFGNTAIKAGRQTLPKSLSPWAWSDRTAGVVDASFDGVVIANTDLADTTLVGGWVKRVYVNQDTQGNVSDKGLFMGSVINKSVSGTTLALTGYFIPDSQVVWDGPELPDGTTVPVAGLTGEKNTWSIWASSESKVGDIVAGAQFAYADGSYSNTDATYAFAGKIGGKWGSFDATAIAGYVNDGDYSLKTAGSGFGTSAFWLDNEIDGDVMGEKYFGLLGKAGYAINESNAIRGSLGYWNFDDKRMKSAWGARIGYHVKGLNGISGKIEYRYANIDMVGAPKVKRQRVRVEAYYKF